MDLVRKRITRSVVATGSVWESRMKVDEVEGGIVVFNGGEDEGDEVRTDGVRRLPSPGPAAKRRTWRAMPKLGVIKRPRSRWRAVSTEPKECDSAADDERRECPQTKKTTSEGDRVIIPSTNLGSDVSRVPDDVDGDHDNNKVTEKRPFEEDEVELCKDSGVCAGNDDNVAGGDGSVVTVDGSCKDESKIKEIVVAETNHLQISSVEEKEMNVLHGRSPSPVRKLDPVAVHQSGDTDEALTCGDAEIVSAINVDDIPETRNSLQFLVDLVMWKNVSKSTLAFGLGTFFMLSSSCAKDLNISFISVVSYMSLLYLAATFMYRSFIRRAGAGNTNRGFVVEEEDAVWILRLGLPYLNDFLGILRNLFSGDPATTIKLAVLLYVSARCGSCITLWNLVRFGFLGAFIVPRIYSAYSSLLAQHAEFWVNRFADAYVSCTHKKVVAGAVFTLVWNLSSVVARLWSVFFLFVAVRYYQQYVGKDDGGDEEASSP